MSFQESSAVTYIGGDRESKLFDKVNWTIGTSLLLHLLQ